MINWLDFFTVHVLSAYGLQFRQVRVKVFLTAHSCTGGGH